MDAVWPYLAAILPTILVAILFYFLIKSMLEGDRRERLAQRRFEAEQDRAESGSGPDTTESEGDSPS
jgi:bacterioferritin (cytochrome b1)